MPQPSENAIQTQAALPDIPALWVSNTQAALMTPDGEIQILSHSKAQQILHKKAAIVCHAPYTCRKLELHELLCFDVLELFAFVHPALFTVPTPAGLTKTLGLGIPNAFEDIPFALMDIARALLTDLWRDPWQAKADPLKIANVMGQQGKGWPWTPYVFSALNETYEPSIPPESRSSLNIWKNLPEWAEEAPEPPPSHHPVTGEESRERLEKLLGPKAEQREQQLAYATALTAAFAPRSSEDNEELEPQTVLAEAGTGVGKTLGYLAPASVWAEKNKGTVWISTYTKNLQRQIEQELGRLYPDPVVKDNRVAIRKGRENYLCLLNLEDAAAGAALSRHPGDAIAAGIMARWAAATKDGDLTGSDFPGWLVSLLGPKNTSMLSDRRGECLFSACDHYHRCFVERAVRKAKHADIVVANHALVMIQTALSVPGDELPQRYVLDEGHHLFDAADGAFAGHLTARETADLRRWIRGAEGGRKSRARGLKRRAEDLASGDPVMEKLLQEVMEISTCLPTDGWSRRLKDAQPKGPVEKFMLAVRSQVQSRVNQDGPYTIETETRPLAPGVVEAAGPLKKALKDLQKPMLALAAAFRKKLKEQAETLDSDTRKRLDAVQQSLERRAHMSIGAWINMLQTLQDGSEGTLPQNRHSDLHRQPSLDRHSGLHRHPGESRDLPVRGREAPAFAGVTNNSSQDELFVDWMQIEKVGGQSWDIGLYRHWVDPMIPFAKAIKPHAHGMAITSATLRDGTDDDAENWRVAGERTGVPYLTSAPVQDSFQSPFDYAQQTKIFIITDVQKNDLEQVASAYRALFEASGGGALGIFTAIQRLRAVHSVITPALSEKDINVYAQHVDEMDNGTLVDVFRDDCHACLLGVDAMRDGVDVPGESLRLIVFDKVPWPRPTILHKARREAFGGQQRYDDLITRLKLKQAYGRLIRRANDKGVFVMLDSGMPTRLCGAFPDGVEVQRVGLKECCEEIGAFLDS